MTKIKFTDARFPYGDLDEIGIKRRFEGHLRKLRALRNGVQPQILDDFSDALRWEGDLSEVQISSNDRNKILRRTQYLVQRRAALSEGEWNARKHGGPKRRVWRKIHLGIDEQTLEVRAVEITGSHIGDAPVLPDLLNQIPTNETISSVTADGAYDTRKCHDAIADRGAHAVIPPRKNAKPWKTVTAGAVARNEALRASKYLGRAIWRNWSGYHRRSRVEI